jgi:hypothetical protein
MMFPHASTLAFVARRIPARRRTLLLLPIGLDDVDAAKGFKASLNQLIKPGIWQFPIFAVRNPRGIGPAIPLNPSTIIRPVWQPHPQTLTFSTAKQDRYALLIPYLIETLTRGFVQGRPRG